uniref:Uncharacterized protein n=1 Tax=Eucampia antarctica TaxID=49252 RepID=A0A7S2R4R1_9STRA|mmetsp:Transcript_1684/g.1601  ORF Transcript_1684/g.1601 Transcript_1684/m.1601 type:complete len:137 (+) Transcript_1684:77-487(+)
MKLILGLLLGILTSQVASFSNLPTGNKIFQHSINDGHIHHSLLHQQVHKKPRLILLNGIINKDDGSDKSEEDIGTPIELESLQQEAPTMFGLEKTQDFDALDTGVPLFTGGIIFVFSIYFMLSLVFFDEPDPLSLT